MYRFRDKRRYYSRNGTSPPTHSISSCAHLVCKRQRRIQRRRTWPTWGMLMMMMMMLMMMDRRGCVRMDSKTHERDRPALCPTSSLQPLLMAILELWSLSTPAAVDQLHLVTSSSHPQKQSATALRVSPSQDQLRGTLPASLRVDQQCLSQHFAVYA